MTSARAFTLEDGGRALARSLTDGSIIWSQQARVGGPPGGPPSPSGARVAITGRKELLVLAGEDGRQLHEWPLPAAATCLAMGEGGQIALGTHGGAILVRTPEGWRSVQAFRGKVTTLGRRAAAIVAGGAGGQLCHLVLGGGSHRQLCDEGPAVTAVSMLSDGALLAGRADGVIERWALGEERPSQTFTGAEGPIRALAIAGGWILAAGEERLIHRWDALAAQALAPLAGHARPVLAMGIAGDGRLWTAGKDQILRCWAADQAAPFPALSGHGGGVRACCLVGDDAFTGSRDGAVRRWSVATGRPLETWLRGSSAVTAMVLTPDGGLVAGRSDGSMVRLDAPRRTAWQQRRTHQGPLACLAWLDGLVLSGGADGVLRIWDGASGAPVSARLDHGSRLRCLALSADGALVATGGYDGSLVVASPLGGGTLGRAAGHQGPVVGCAWVGERVVTVGMDGILRSWSARGEALGSVWAHGDGAVGVRSLGGRRAASVGGDGRLCLWGFGAVEGEPALLAELDLGVPLDGLGADPRDASEPRLLVGDRYGGAHAAAVAPSA